LTILEEHDLSYDRGYSVLHACARHEYFALLDHEGGQTQFEK